jgi:DNA-binding transcriptional LysR family regulator
MKPTRTPPGTQPNHAPQPLDWSDLRVFLHVSNLGTSKASELLRMDVTTVRRRVSALERSFGSALVVRNGRAFRLTPEGEHVRAIASRMEALQRELDRDATDGARDLDGVVRISTMEGFGGAYLAPRIGPFLSQHPRLSVQLVTAPHIVNLAEREADLSINMVRPRAGRLIVRRLAQFGVGLYGSRAYLKAHGVPTDVAALSQHRFVTYVDELVAVPQVRWLPGTVLPAQCRLASTSLIAQMEAVRSGAGLAMLPHFMAHQSPLVRLLPEATGLTRDWWLVVHQDLQNVPRIRMAIDFVSGIMARDRDLLLGRAASSGD